MSTLRTLTAAIARCLGAYCTQFVFYWMTAMAVGGLAGCAAYQNVVTLDLRAGTPNEAMIFKKPLQEIRVAVSPFHDQRAQPHGIGRYTRFWGKQVPLVIEGAHLGEVLALDTVDYLKHVRGWHTWIDKPDIVMPPQGIDLTLSASVMEWMTDATDWGVATQVQTRLMLDMQLIDVKRRLTVPTHIVKEQSSWIMGFDAREIGEGVSELFHHALDELLERSRSLLPPNTTEGQK